MSIKSTDTSEERLASELISSLEAIVGKAHHTFPLTRLYYDRGRTTILFEYSYEGGFVNIEGFVKGGITLRLDDALALMEEVQSSENLAMGTRTRTFRFIKSGNMVRLLPIVTGGSSFKERTDSPDRVMQSVTTEFQVFLKKLTSLEGIIARFLPKEVGYAGLEQKWHNARIASDVNAKGRLLEEILARLVDMDGCFTIHDQRVRTESEEIDIVLGVGKEQPFWSGIASPLILVECKNWNSPLGAKEIRDFAQKIQNRPRVACNLGFLIGVSGFTRDATQELIGQRGRDYVIATVNGDEIEKIIKLKQGISELLRRKFTESSLR